jgi:hypothetical protein
MNLYKLDHKGHSMTVIAPDITSAISIAVEHDSSIPWEKSTFDALGCISITESRVVDYFPHFKNLERERADNKRLLEEIREIVEAHTRRLTQPEIKITYEPETFEWLRKQQDERRFRIMEKAKEIAAQGDGRVTINMMRRAIQQLE